MSDWYQQKKMILLMTTMIIFGIQFNCFIFMKVITMIRQNVFSFIWIYISQIKHSGIDWLQKKFYIRLLVNATKRTKNHPFCGARFFINIWIIIMSPLQPAPLKKYSGPTKTPNVDRETCTTILSVFWFGSNPHWKYLSL